MKYVASLKVGKISPIRGTYRTTHPCVCEYCGDMFRSRIGKANRFCSQDCYFNHRKSIGKMVGRMRSQKQYNQWATSVKERDGHCVYCHSEVKLIAHHIVPVRKDFSKVFDLSNGQAVCYSCHNILHNNVLNFLSNKRVNSGKPRTGNPEPSVQSTKVQRLLEHSDVLNNQTSALPEREEIVQDR